MKRENLETFFFDLDLPLVDSVVPFDHVAGHLRPTLPKRGHRFIDGLLDHRPHRQQVLLEFFQVACQVDRHG